MFFYNFLNKNDAIPTLINKWEAELMSYGVDTILVQDVFKICYKIPLVILLPSGYNFEFCIELFLLENTLRKLTLKFLIVVVFVWKMLK